ncbi:MAG: translation initiation factor IF-6 [Candidatus Aenigmarchaeota archaeon]|nr:translation initiation factor IF-6 [Candidatus Aenigmarchaeota archaeon]
MKVLQTNFHGDHNLGLFGEACDRFCILGNFVSEKNKTQVENVLKVRVIKLTIANTDFVGMFCCFNSNGILLPKIVTEKEIEELKKIKKEFGINLDVLNSRFTAIGNLVLCNDKGAIISRLLSKKDKEKIEDCLGVESGYSKIAGMSIVGSCGITTNKGCLLHRDAREEEIEIIQELLKVNADVGTANFGSPFVGSCSIANSNGCLVGKSTSGPEVQRFFETLGFQ